MPIAKLGDSSCAVSRSLSVLGERWTLLVLRLAFEGVTRFDAFRDGLGVPPTCSPNGSAPSWMLGS